MLVGGGFSIMMLTIAAAGLIDPMLGALLHNGGAIFVVANSARLLKEYESRSSSEATVQPKENNAAQPMTATAPDGA